MALGKKYAERNINNGAHLNFNDFFLIQCIMKANSFNYQ